ncbi:amidohydrolase family protein [Scleromatobacter humisilvae]|uniref:Amidohydrolase n=1 Tax=Scleromatobacter humisilvae TaxID=2897159 RepID=A0A9X1YG34_9BURK|nr:amidohydrolase family protein [Scleromatobacter humisilvae]MCK9685694.1 amidohydrolase [Scleromatobacter humisilvae]
MEFQDMVLVSVDDHLIEPDDMFIRHMPAKFKDRAPKVVRGSNGAHQWQLEGMRAPGLGLNAVAGRPREEYGFEPVSYEQVRKGCYDIDARIGDMNANGVLGSICFGSFPGFAGARFQKMQDKELALATIRAYNDWHVHDWCGKYPERFIKLALLPLWDVSLAVAEVERMVKLGVHAVSFPENPALIGLPSLHADVWEPLWATCEANKVVLCCHIGSAGNAPYPSDESPIDAWITSMPISIANAASDWLFASFWKRYPGLRMALSEGGIGWIPYLLERADFTYQQHSPWTRTTFGKERPSDVFRRHIITCFIDDDFGVRNRQDIGIDMITWEADYPHSDATWPHSPEHLWKSLRNLPAYDIDRMTHLNAMREFSYDPFSAMGGRDKCTVGALRALATGVDTAPMSRGGLNPSQSSDRPVTSADIKKILSHM